MSTFRIISFDGGGIRGALSTRLLKRLSDANPELLEKTDLVAGTSTGALIALLIAYGYNANQIDEIYNYQNIKRIFTPRRPNMIMPKFSNKYLKKFVTDSIPEKTKIKDLKKYIFIPSFNVQGVNQNHWEGIFFNNLCDNFTINQNVIDVALAASAAPTYFPSHNGYIDGGLITNSPSIASVLTSMHCLKPKHDITDFKLISIGTGKNQNRITNNTKNWGVLQWALRPFASVKLPIFSIMLNDSLPLEDLYCTELMDNNFYRINPLLFDTIELDDYKKVPYIKELADNYDLSKANQYIKDIYLC